MSKLIGRLLVVLAFGWAGSASATLMAPVTVNGQEWLQPLDFINTSWNNIAAVCDPTSGICAGSLNGNDLSGWTWASVGDVNALFNYYIGYSELGPGPDHTDFHPGTNWLTGMIADGFSPTYINEPNKFINAFVRTTDGVGVPYYTQIMYGCFDICPFQIAYTDGTYPSDASSFYVGSWFSRSVPTPATLPLLGIALAALGYSQRKRITS